MSSTFAYDTGSATPRFCCASVTPGWSAQHDTIIQPDHHVIMFVANKRMIPKVKKLFQGGFGFV